MTTAEIFDGEKSSTLETDKEGRLTFRLKNNPSNSKTSKKNIRKINFFPLNSPQKGQETIEVIRTPIKGLIGSTYTEGTTGNFC